MRDLDYSFHVDAQSTEEKRCRRSKAGCLLPLRVVTHIHISLSASSVCDHIFIWKRLVVIFVL